MDIIILAAGYATRLYPLTENTPKPLLPVGGKPIIEHILAKLEKLKLHRIFIVTNAKFYTLFLAWKASCVFPLASKLVMVNDGTQSNEDRLGAIGDIHFVIQQHQLKNDILVIGGDNLFEFSLLAFYQFFKKKKASVVALYDIHDAIKAAKKFGVVELDTSQKIIGFEEKPEHPKTSLVSTACYLFTHKDVCLLEQCIRENKKPDNPGEFIKWLSHKTAMYGYVFSEQWFDIGHPHEYASVNKLFSL